jgi:cysteine desulfuration protein SufE
MSEESTKERAARLIEEFTALDDWMERYNHLVAMGDSMAQISSDVRSEDNYVPGCQSDLWIRAAVEPATGFVHFQVDSDSRITRGMAALIIRVLDGQPPEVIVGARLDFIDQIGFRQHLSAQRRNGLAAMIHWMKSRARAYLNGSPAAENAHPGLS